MKKNKFLILMAILIFSLTPVYSFAEGPPNIAAKGAIAMDYETGTILYEKDINTPRSVASMTKVMTALLVYDAIAEGKMTSDTKIPITPDARAIIPWDPCGMNVSYAKEETVYDLLSIYFIVSSSPAGTSFAHYLGGSVPQFVEMMNEKAKELGIDAHYNDPNGLEPNSVTPLAQAKLIRHFIQKYPEVLEITKQRSVNFSGRHYPANNKFYRNFSWYQGNVDGFKSGTMPFAGYCFSATAQRNGHRVITVVINSSDTNQRYRDSIKLLDYAFTKYPLEYPTSKWAEKLPIEAEQMGFNTAILQGKKSFDGTEPITRGEFCSMLLKALKLPDKEGENFLDVNPESWYAKDIISAKAYGFVHGTGNGKFEPQSFLTRQEMALMLQNVLHLENNGEKMEFKDDYQIAPPFKESVSRMSQYHIIQGTDEGYFFPTNLTTRESATSMMLNLYYEIKNGKLPNYRVEIPSSETPFVPVS